MSTSSHELITVLEAVLEVQQRLLELSREKQQTVMESRVPELDKIVREEQALIARQTELERRRVTLVRQLTAELGLTGADLTLAALAAALPEPERRTLAALGEKLGQTLNALKKNNDINSKLLSGRLEALKLLIDSSSSQRDSNFYGAHGEDVRQPGRKISLYDRSV